MSTTKIVRRYFDDSDCKITNAINNKYQLLKHAVNDAFVKHVRYPKIADTQSVATGTEAGRNETL